MKTMNYWIENLKLSHHPEGGYYRRTFESDIIIENRRISSCIQFLIGYDEKSHFHRLDSDELWCFQYGSSAELIYFDDSGNINKVKLGLDVNNGEMIQYLVKKNTIFGVYNKSGYSLFTCFVTPEFNFDSFYLYNKKELNELYPNNKEIINYLAIR